MRRSPAGSSPGRSATPGNPSASAKTAVIPLSCRIKWPPAMSSARCQWRSCGCGTPANPVRLKPVGLLALVQHDLQRRQPERQQAEAEEIDVRLLVALDVGRVLD